MNFALLAKDVCRSDFARTPILRRLQKYFIDFTIL